MLMAHPLHLAIVWRILSKENYEPFLWGVLGDALSRWAHGVVVSHPLRMRKALGSNPSVYIVAESQFAGVCVEQTLPT